MTETNDAMPAPESDEDDAMFFSRTKRVLDRLARVLDREYVGVNDDYTRQRAGFVVRVLERCHLATIHDDPVHRKGAEGFRKAWGPCLRAAMDAHGGLAKVAEALADHDLQIVIDAGGDPEMKKLGALESEKALVPSYMTDRAAALAVKIEELTTRLRERHAVRVAENTVLLETLIGTTSPYVYEGAKWRQILYACQDRPASFPEGFAADWLAAIGAMFQAAGAANLAPLLEEVCPAQQKGRHVAGV